MAALRRQDQQQRDMAMAWHAAAFTRADKLPHLKTVLARLKIDTGPQTYEQMKANMEVISLMTGAPLREVKH